MNSEFKLVGGILSHGVCSAHGVYVSAIKLNPGDKLPEGMLKAQAVGESLQPSFITMLTDGSVEEYYYDARGREMKFSQSVFPHYGLVTQHNDTGIIPAVSSHSGCEMISIAPVGCLQQTTDVVGALYRTHRYMDIADTHIVGDSEFIYVHSERFTVDSQVFDGYQIFKSADFERQLIAEVEGFVLEFDTITDVEEFERRSKTL